MNKSQQENKTGESRKDNTMYFYYTLEKYESDNTIQGGGFYEVEGWRDTSLENTKKDFLKGTTVGSLGDPTMYRIVKVTHEIIQ